jgi:hypothetical protein
MMNINTHCIFIVTTPFTLHAFGFKVSSIINILAVLERFIYSWNPTYSPRLILTTSRTKAVTTTGLFKTAELPGKIFIARVTG